MTSKLTREELTNIIETDHVQCGEAAYLARMALAAMDSEPVAFINGAWTLVYYRPPKESGLKIGDKLYRHAQQPVVPDDLSIFEAAIEECKKCDSIDEHAWNHGVLAVIAEYESCRAAMLNGGK